MVSAIIVSIAPAASPSINSTMKNISSVGFAGKYVAPTKAPRPVKRQIELHIRRIFIILKLFFLMLTVLDIASGRFARNTPAINARLIPSVLVASMPMTSDSGIASIKIPSQIASAAPLAVFADANPSSLISAGDMAWVTSSRYSIVSVSTFFYSCDQFLM